MSQTNDSHFSLEKQVCDMYLDLFVIVLKIREWHDVCVGLVRYFSFNGRYTCGAELGKKGGKLRRR
jgi:hypothetical protein